MRVVIFHPVPLPPKNYGGVERVVLWLARGLVERGHEVWVAARMGSRLPDGARLLAIPENDGSPESLLERLPPETDVVHFMAPPGNAVLERLPCGAILTVHGNGKPGERFPLNSVFLSQDHARRHRANVFVYNGIDPAEYKFQPQNKKKDWFLFLSKTSWSVKNLEGAIHICAQAGVDLRIAGGQRPLWLRLKAYLSSMKWCGPVAGEKKAALLAEARALIFPVIWPEPFGLVVVEALMSGTPVIASRKGSLAELLPAGAGLTLAAPVSAAARVEWVELLTALKGSKPGPVPSFWDAERIRAWAIERFHYSKMAEGYEDLYKRVIQKENLHDTYPVAGDWRTQ